MNKVILKPHRERSLLQRHPWIFSGAIASMPPTFENGEIFPVYSASGQFLAKAYFHRQNSLAGRVMTFEDISIEEALKALLKDALALRKQLGLSSYRLINGEGDHCPGLIIDRYEDVFVLQAHTLGIERLKPKIVQLLIEEFQPRAIYEKSFSSSRKLEGLEESEGLLWGEEVGDVAIEEDGLHFLVPVLKGQKTGFFLDQRRMRKEVEHLARGRRVLNCFAYTGGFSLYALRGGAQKVSSVEISAFACDYIERHTQLNGFSLERHRILQRDAFDVLQNEGSDYDLIILDPPAFAKKRADLKRASAAYLQLNQMALKKIAPRGLLLTASCSYFVNEELFRTLLFQAALAAGRQVKILGKHRQAEDHPLSLFHREGEYLKSFLLYTGDTGNFHNPPVSPVYVE